MEPSPPPPPFATPPPFSVPPPPPSGSVFGRPATQPRRPGQLTDQWTAVFWIGWLLVAASFVAVWYSSRLLGLSTWWLGPSTEPQLIIVSLLPFTAPLALCVSGLMRVRYLPWWGIAGALFVAGIAAFDIDRVPGFAAVEFSLALAGLLISLAAFAGMYRTSR